MKSQKILVAVNKNDEFFALVEGFTTTSPAVTHDILQAKVLTTENYPQKSPPSYYLESSYRMRQWLEGFESKWYELSYDWRAI